GCQHAVDGLARLKQRAGVRIEHFGPGDIEHGSDTLNRPLRIAPQVDRAALQSLRNSRGVHGTGVSKDLSVPLTDSLLAGGKGIVDLRRDNRGTKSIVNPGGQAAVCPCLPAIERLPNDRVRLTWHVGKG